jgi:membrane fusion protein, copper/silver efflux system
MKNTHILTVCAITALAILGAAAVVSATSERKVLYYRNPMNPQIISPVPLKDAMGMDYVPVYEEEQAAGQARGVYISPQSQQLVGIKTEKVKKRHLAYELTTVGRVAYDPGLFVAQEEYLQALALEEKTRDSALASTRQQTRSLVDAARQKLLLLGMSQPEIEKLSSDGKPQRNLYLPGATGKPWVYLAVYEYEIGLIKEGLPVEVEAVAFPGRSFAGKIISITPVFDPQTRSAQVRAEVDDPGYQLKPEMFVNARIHIDWGEKLAMPEAAVMDTGEHKVVFVASPPGHFAAREVKLGIRAGDYYEVLSGAEEGEEVVSEGSFFIDSESKLKLH